MSGKVWWTGYYEVYKWEGCIIKYNELQSIKT